MDIDSPSASSVAPGNRRGRRSRQEILDAASRVMAVRGYAASSMSVLAKEAGLPKSVFYHHFESKAELLAEVMARGAREFFAAMRTAQQDPPDAPPRARLRWYFRTTGEVSATHEDFLRLLLALIVSEADAPAAMRTVVEVRDEGRDHMRHMIRSAFLPAGEENAALVARELAHFGMAGFDGAFVSAQSGDRRPMAEFMAELADALAALGEARIAARAAGRAG